MRGMRFSDGLRGVSALFVEKICALMGYVPSQFEPLMYVFSFLAFLWLCDGFLFMLRSMIDFRR